MLLDGELSEMEMELRRYAAGGLSCMISSACTTLPIVFITDIPSVESDGYDQDPHAITGSTRCNCSSYGLL